MLSMIQALIPLGLQAVAEALQRDVTALAGARYAPDDGTPGVERWGQQRGVEWRYPCTQASLESLPRAYELRVETYCASVYCHYGIGTVTFACPVHPPHPFGLFRTT